MKNKFLLKTYQVILHPVAWTCKMQIVLHVINHEKNTRTTYDKLKGKQVYHSPHIVPASTKIPADCIELPNHVERMKQIYGIK